MSRPERRIGRQQGVEHVGSEELAHSEDTIGRTGNVDACRSLLGAASDERMSPRGGGELTCAEQDDGGASVAPSYDTVEARQGAL